MDLRQMRYFVAVAEEAHFGRAAQRLHIVQPALSMQIRALEQEVGGSLFLRTSRRVELTEAGTLLLQEARRTLAQAERAKAIVQQSLRGEIGTVRVGFAGNAVLTGKLMDDLRAFHQRYPAAQLVLLELAPHVQGAAILAGDMDVGYSPSAGLALDAQLRAEKKGIWPLVVAMASDHPLARTPCVSITALAAEPLILYAMGEGGEDLAVLRQQVGSAANVVHRVSSTLSTLALAAAGWGLALVPASLEQVRIPNLVYRPLAEAGMATDLVLVSRVAETSGAVLAYLALARQETL